MSANRYFCSSLDWSLQLSCLSFSYFSSYQLTNFYFRQLFELLSLINAIIITATFQVVTVVIAGNSSKLRALCLFNLVIGQADLVMTFYSALEML